MSEFDEGWDAGKRARDKELLPLVEAIQDALFMFKDIEKARELPAYGNAIAQYVAMGKQLERLLKLSGLPID